MAKNGNAVVLEWYFAKVKETGNQSALSINAANSDGYQPIFLACWQGYKSILDEEADKKQIIENRTKVVKLLLDNGALSNVRSSHQGMTPLHWAAYHGDEEIVDELLKSGALQLYNEKKLAPVDVAGFRGKGAVVEIFCRHLAQHIVAEKTTVVQ